MSGQSVTVCDHIYGKVKEMVKSSPYSIKPNVCPLQLIKGCREGAVREEGGEPPFRSWAGGLYQAEIEQHQGLYNW